MLLRQELSLAVNAHGVPTVHHAPYTGAIVKMTKSGSYMTDQNLVYQNLVYHAQFSSSHCKTHLLQRANFKVSL